VIVRENGVIIVRLLHECLFHVRPHSLATTIKRLIGVPREMVETRRGRYFVDPISLFGRALIREGLYNANMIKTLDESLFPGGVYVDVGAYEGYQAILAAKLVGPSGRVIAVEPQTRLHEVFRRNLKENGVERVVELCDAAISDEEGSAKLLLAPETTCGQSRLGTSSGKSKDSEIVRVTTLAKLLADKKVGRIDLLKIDVTGHEYEAVLGSKEVFASRKVKRIALKLYPELLGERGKSAAGLTAYIQGCGYRRLEQFENLVFELKF
jgi:FkbM family methyltransferase